MAMKFFSDVTRKFYDTEEDCKKAESAAVEKAAAEKASKEREALELRKKREEAAANRKAAAEEVAAARKAMLDAKREYREVLESFCSKYGAYHQTVDNSDIPTLFNSFFDFI